MGVARVIFHDHSPHGHHVRFKRALNIVNTRFRLAVGIGQMGLDAGYALAKTAQRVAHDELQVLKHFVASVSVWVGVKQDLHDGFLF